MSNRVYRLILRAPDGQERRTLAWFPTDAARQSYYAKAHRRGLEIEEE